MWFGERIEGYGGEPTLQPHHVVGLTFNVSRIIASVSFIIS